MSITNTFFIALKNFRRNLLLNIFIIFQIGLSICVTYLVYSMVIELNELPRVYKNFNNTNAYYIAPRMDYGKYHDILQSAEEKALLPYNDVLNSPDMTDEKYNKIYPRIESGLYDILSSEVPELINNIPNLKEVYAYNSNYYITDGVNNIDFMSKETAEKLNYRMMSGKWLSNAENTGDCLNVVVNSKSSYNVNEKIELKCMCSDGSEKIIPAIVVGKTREKCLFNLGMSVGGSFSYSADDQLDTIITQSTDFINSPFMCVSDDNSAKLLEGVMQKQECNFIIELKDNLSEEEYRNTEKFCQDNGIFFMKIDNLYKNSKDNFNILLKQKSVLIGCSILITLIGIISFIILILYKDKKIKAIYNIVGMNNKEYYLVNFFYALIIICASLILFIAFMVVIGLLDYSSFISSSAYNYFVNNGISFQIPSVAFINIPYEYMLFAFIISGIIFGFSAFVSSLFVNRSDAKI